MNYISGFLLILFSFNGFAVMKHVAAYLDGLKGFSGVVAVKHGELVPFKKAYGYANYEFDIPNMLTTRFCIASITKTFTAVLVMKLVEEGKVRLEDPINRYIPDFAGGDTITVHHLLTHTSGIRNYRHTDAIFDGRTLAEMVDLIKKWDLDFEPGTNYRYGNTGYLLLAYIVELVCGQPFDQCMQHYIFGPAGMVNSGSIADENVIKRKAQGYTQHGESLHTVPGPIAPLTLLGNGNLYASADDLFRFVTALRRGLLIDRYRLIKMTSKHVAMESSGDRYHAYGLFVDKKEGKNCIEMTGALRGYLSTLIHFPDEDITVVILTNVEDRDLFLEVVQELPKLVLKDIKNVEVD